MAKRKPSIPNKPGRFIPGYEDDQTSNEHVELPVSDAMLRQMADELKGLKVTLDEKKAELAKVKDTMREPESRYRELLEAISTGKLSEWRDVYRFADDEANTVALYDKDTLELIATREISSWERQQDMEFEDQDEDESDDE